MCNEVIAVSLFVAAGQEASDVAEHEDLLSMLPFEHAAVCHASSRQRASPPAGAHRHRRSLTEL